MGAQQGVHASYSWAAQAAAPIAEDLQVAATQQLHALGDAVHDVRASLSQRCRAWLRRTPSVSRILLRAHSSDGLPADAEAEGGQLDVLVPGGVSATFTELAV